MKFRQSALLDQSMSGGGRQWFAVRVCDSEVKFVARFPQIATLIFMHDDALANALKFRPMRREEFNLAVDWAAAEGWNPGKHDADIFWDTDPEGFVCATLDDEIVATGSIVAYGQSFGFMGFFIVRPDLRSKGLGTKFWFWRRDTLKARLLPDAPIGMDGVFAMQDWYAQGGFQFTHRNLRMAGVGQPSQPASCLTELSAAPFDEVSAYDQRHFGFARDTFLRRWIEPKEGLALGAVRDGKLVGYGVVRACQSGYKIGPLFADDATLAGQLFAALSDRASGEPLFLDTPENNPAALALAKENGMEEVFGCARMYYGTTPSLPWANIYGITTFELG
ncbi:GNAT family N-acetyltransferase [Cerasicoccus arenae]|nr:GNAT family N-acetyltransferase [Cerasicoccus arenae]MBK1858936.1 GNAT family N-acetyltransferase [Cerasicoccus arenae]